MCPLSESDSTSKCCTKCGDPKPLTDYYGGKQPCKECRKKKQREWYAANKEYAAEYYKQYHEAHKEEHREYKRKYYQANAEDIKAKSAKWAAENSERHKENGRRYQAKNRKKEAKRKRAWKDANRQKARECNRAWEEANPERAQESRRKWQKANPDKRRINASVRRARLIGTGGECDAATVWQMAEDQNWLCAYCESPLFGDFEIDHIVPVAKGGTGDWSNLAITCGPCNRSKGAKTLEEFITCHLQIPKKSN